MVSGGGHPGIFIVRKDNNPKKDMTERDVVRAVEKLMLAAANVPNDFQILNHWR